MFPVVDDTCLAAVTSWLGRRVHTTVARARSRCHHGRLSSGMRRWRDEAIQRGARRHGCRKRHDVERIEHARDDRQALADLRRRAARESKHRSGPRAPWCSALKYRFSLPDHCVQPRRSDDIRAVVGNSAAANVEHLQAANGEGDRHDRQIDRAGARQRHACHSSGTAAAQCLRDLHQPSSSIDARLRPPDDHFLARQQEWRAAAESLLALDDDGATCDAWEWRRSS